MSLRGAAEKRTICEVLREINDLMQGDPKHGQVLPLLQEAERMAKKMSMKLYQHNKEYDKDWWDRNPDYQKDIERRLHESYII